MDQTVITTFQVVWGTSKSSNKSWKNVNVELHPWVKILGELYYTQNSKIKKKTFNKICI